MAAVDLGATSGRVVLGQVGPDLLQLQEVARFPNEPVRTSDGLHWDLPGLYREAMAGVAAAHRRSGGLTSVGFDSWAVDYGLLHRGQLLGVPYHYRDERGARGVSVVHEVLGHDELFARNGLQFLPFTTLYQLAADPMVPRADRMLLVPDLLTYWSTGVLQAERTNASTTGLLDVRTGEWDLDLLARLGIRSTVLADLVDPGTVVGPVSADEGGPVSADVTPELTGVPVVTVGSHDTASALVGAPLTADAAFVSCGTWGLVGVELDSPILSDEARIANFTNERGVDGTIRFLTNVMGLWLLSESLRTWEQEGRPVDRSELLAAAGALPPSAATFDVQAPVFLPPGDMPGRIVQWYAAAGLEPPEGQATLVRAILDSIAQGFADAVQETARLAARPVRVINLVGGGALNALLCQSLADRAGLPVLAGPVEATSIGNLLVQARATGLVSGGLDDLRDLVRRTQATRTFRPGRAPSAPALQRTRLAAT